MHDRWLPVSPLAACQAASGNKSILIAAGEGVGWKYRLTPPDGAAKMDR
jgi:hypothetical protein